MIWVTWRQHRGQLGIMALVAAVFGLVILVTGLPLHAAVARFDPACLNGSDLSAACYQLRVTVQDQFAPTSAAIILIGSVLPAVLGIFLGAPLVARELEQGTYRLAWTQSIGRERWLVTKTVVLVVALALLAVTIDLLVGWWRAPLDTLEGTPWAAFDAEGVAPLATTLLGFALGVAAGAIARRSIAAIAIALATLSGVKWMLISFARTYLFAAPLTTSWPPGARPPIATVPGWFFDLYPVSATGQRLSSADLVAVVQRTGAEDPTRGMQLAGVTWTQVYQPAERYWPFQSIEASLLVVFAIGLLAVATWWIARRT
jgi:hypothetical protein